MKHFGTLAAILRDWTEAVAAVIVALLDLVVSPGVVRLIEQDDGSFRVETPAKNAAGSGNASFANGMLTGTGIGPTLAGKRAEIVLHARRFLFRPLDLPPRAADFLDGIVRAQIDRLTPWTASEAVFGCSRPVPGRGDGITTIIAATTRNAADVFIEAAAALRPASIALFADGSSEGGGPIRVFEQKKRGLLDPTRLAGVLRLVLAACVIAGLASSGAALYVADRLGAQEDELARQIAQRRAALRASSDGTARSPIAALEKRKNESAASVIALEALTRALPDHTYLTELHLAGPKMQIVGITRDAPSLIPLIERSSHFSRATFYAPTTRSSSDPGERFHIEARLEPVNTVAP